MTTAVITPAPAATTRPREIYAPQRLARLGVITGPHVIPWRELDGGARLWDPSAANESRGPQAQWDHPLLTVVGGGARCGLAMRWREFDRWAGVLVAAPYYCAWVRPAGRAGPSPVFPPVLRTERGWETLGGDPVAAV
jgi:hypothetical protein